MDDHAGFASIYAREGEVVLVFLARRHPGDPRRADNRRVHRAERPELAVTLRSGPLPVSLAVG